jgi:excisionase family DNA binding protein
VIVSVLTLDEVAIALRVSRRYVEHLVEEGRIRTFKIGRCTRVAPDDLQEFIRACREESEPVAVETTATRTAAPPVPRPVPMPNLPIGLKRGARAHRGGCGRAA